MNDELRLSKKCCDPKEVADIVTCLGELKQIIACVLECLDDKSSSTKERIILCVLLDEIRKIEAKLDNPKFGLKEIKEEIIEINEIVSNSVFGLKEIKNEVRDIENLLGNEFFGLNEIKNEIIELNDLLNNTTFGIPEIKNEIRFIENQTTITNNILTNQVFGLNEIKNEIRGIENGLNRSLSCENDSVRICGEGIDGITRTIRTDQHNVLTALPSASTQSQIGRLFSVAAQDVLFNTAFRNSFSILFDNPPGSGRIMYLDSLFGGTSLEPPNQPLNYESTIGITLVRDATITGNLVDAETNLNFGFPDDSVIRVFVTPTSPNFGGQMVAATREVTGHFFLDFAGRIIIPPGHRISLVLNVRTIIETTNVFAAFTITWYELDEPV